MCEIIIDSKFHHTNCKKTDKVTKRKNTYDNVTTKMAAFRTRALKCKPSAGDMIKKKPEI